MIDFHSHILPGVDDGSRSTEESVRMLGALREQGVDVCAATPHFYASRRSPEEFLERRERAMERLRPALQADMPEILLGAEVRYYPGISHMEHLSRLTLEGSNLLLLEMPFSRWSDYMLREVVDLARGQDLTLLLAHIERYLSNMKPATWDLLLQEGVLIQSNAEFFLPLWTRARALKLLKEGKIHLLGTDCHNMGSRRPRMDEAEAVIRGRLGRKPLREMQALGRSMISGGLA